MVAIAVAGGWILRASETRGWIEGPWLGVPIAALAFACFGVAQSAGGSGFIASFCGGLTFGALAGERKEKVLEGAETVGEAFSLVTANCGSAAEARSANSSTASAPAIASADACGSGSDSGGTE